MGKNDEFYTRLEDIENELQHYKAHFADKVVFCNCDNPEWSNFWAFFQENFDHLGLRRLVATHYVAEGSSYKLEINRDFGNREIVRTPLEGNGDFRSPECVELLKAADIIITNLPFSLFREYVAQLVEHDKKFLIIGPMNAITYKDVFRLIQQNRIWLGYGFKGNAGFFINRHYEDYATASSKMEGTITFMDKFNPDHFEIVRFRKGDDGRDLSINGVRLYFRIVVRKK